MIARLRALRWALLVLFVFSGYPAASFGQIADSVFALKEITVSASRIGVPASRAPQRITVLGQADIAATGSRTVADILAVRSGFFIPQYGQGLAAISHRGGAAGHTQVLIDGMRLSDPQAGQFDLNLLPLHLFDSMEVLHGPSSSVYGADGMSGAVYLRGARGGSGRASVATEVGAWGALLTSAGWAFGKGSVSGVVSGEYRRSKGDFPYQTEAGEEMRRENSDREGWSVMGTLQGRTGRHTLRGAFFHIDWQQHLPGSILFGAQGDQQWDTHSRLWLEDAVSLGSGALVLRGFMHRGKLRYLNPHPVWGQDVTGRTTTSRLEAAYRLPAGTHLDVSVGATAGYGAADNPSLESSVSEFRSGAFVSAAGAYGRWRIYPAVRFDTYRESDRTLSALSPRLGINVQPVDRFPLFVKANVGGGFRVPTFNDRFWAGVGNPDLKPERLYSADAGLQVDGRAVQFEAAVYAARYSNRIIWTPDDEDGFVWSPKNLAKTRALGIETSISARVNEELAVGALHTWTHAVDRSDSSSPAYNERLPFLPAHLVKPYVSAKFGRVSVDLHGRFMDRRFTTPGDKEDSLDPAFVVGAQVGFAWNAGPFSGRLSAIVENAFDMQYTIVGGYPMPPRHARLRLVLQTR